MITIIYGVPGSGKTYYSVYWIRKRCLEEGDTFYRVRSDVLLITNLKLRLDNEENYIYLEDVKDFARYMDVDFWRANLSRVQGKKVYIVMDECQLFFHYYKDDPKVLFYLQYHRHLSHDILLITQTPKSLPAKVFELSEFLIEAVPKSVNPFAFRGFRYRVVHPFDRSVVLRRFHLAYDNTVFFMYEDMIYRADE
jgi:zona occludens toxin